MTLQKLRTATTKGVNRLADNYLRGTESALVVSWWDCILLSVFTMLIFIFLGPIVDSIYLYINGTVNNSLTANFYTTSDLKTTRDLYNIYQWVPYLALGVIIYYALNYSNIKKGE